MAAQRNRTALTSAPNSQNFPKGSGLLVTKGPLGRRRNNAATAPALERNRATAKKLGLSGSTASVQEPIPKLDNQRSAIVPPPRCFTQCATASEKGATAWAGRRSR